MKSLVTDSNPNLNTALKLPMPILSKLEGYRIQRESGGFIAELYHCVSDTQPERYYLKRHSLSSSHDSRWEYKAHRWLLGKLPIAAAVAYAEEDGYAWLLLKEMPGLRFEVWEGRKNIEGLAEIIGRALGQVHSIPVLDCDLDQSLEAKLRRVKRNIEHKRLRPDLYKKGGRDAEADYRYLLCHRPDTEESVLTHGDFNLRNLLFDQEGVCAFLDLGEVGVSDSYQDFATLYWSFGHDLKGSDREHAEMLIESCVRSYGLERFNRGKLQYYLLLNGML